jgi:hypothetical protein
MVNLSIISPALRVALSIADIRAPCSEAPFSSSALKICVATARGNVVLASDATHFYANIRGRDPFPIVVDVAAMLEGYETLERLADSPDHIVPGHDPEVMRRYRDVAEGVVALHEAPLKG